MIFSIAVILVCFVLLTYWLRYASLLIIETRRSVEHSQALAARIRLNYQGVREQLRDPQSDLGKLDGMLDQDYRLINTLLAGADSEHIEQRLLRVNYSVSRGLFRVCRFGSDTAARKYLGDMVEMLDFLAGCAAQESA